MQAQPAPRTHPPGGKTAAFRAALPYTLPICVGFLFLGMSYGFLMRSQGFSVWYPLFMSMFIFAGSMEFVTANLLLTHPAGRRAAAHDAAHQLPPPGLRPVHAGQV